MGFSVQSGITASAGTGPLLSRMVNEVTNVAPGTGVQLFRPPFGEECIVINAGANNLNVYPNAGGQINALAANAPLVVLPGTTVRFISTSNLQWYASP